MNDTIDVDVMSLKLNNLEISKPKKTEDSLFGRMAYDSHNLHLHLENVEVIKHKVVKHLSKYYTVLFLKVKKRMCKKMVEFDTQCIEQVKSNIGSWFAKALDENVIEEYYTSSVCVSDKAGFVVKLKLQGADDLLENGKYDIVASLKGVRFYKQRFIPEWEIISAKRLDEDFLNSIVEEEDIWEEHLEDDEPPEPDAEEICSIVNSLEHKLAIETRTIEEQLAGLQNKLARYQELKGGLDEFCAEKVQRYSVLNTIVDALDQINYGNE
jgi:hypothetical protein